MSGSYTDSGVTLFNGSYANSVQQLWATFGSGGGSNTGPNILASTITVDANPSGGGFIKFQPHTDPSTLSTTYGTLIFPGDDETTSTYIDENISKHGTIPPAPTFSTNTLTLTFARDFDRIYTDIAVRGIQLFGNQFIDPAVNNGALGYLVGDIASGEVYLYANSFDTPVMNASTMSTLVLNSSTINTNTISSLSVTASNVSTAVATISTLNLSGTLTIPSLSTNQANAGSLSTNSISTNTMQFSTINGDLGNVSTLSTVNMSASNAYIGNLSTGSLYSPVGFISSLSTSNLVNSGNVQTSSMNANSIVASTFTVTTFVSSFVSTISSSVITCDTLNANTLSTGSFTIGVANISSISTNSLSTIQANIGNLSTISIANTSNISTNSLVGNTITSGTVSANTSLTVTGVNGQVQAPNGIFSTLSGVSTLQATKINTGSISSTQTSAGALNATTVSTLLMIATNASISTIGATTGNFTNLNVSGPIGSPAGTFGTLNVVNGFVSHLTTDDILTGPLTAGALTANSISTNNATISSATISSINSDVGTFSTIYVSSINLPNVNPSGVSTNTISTNYLYAGQAINNTLDILQQISTPFLYSRNAAFSTLNASAIEGTAHFTGNTVNVDNTLNVSTLNASTISTSSAITAPAYLFSAKNGGQVPFSITTNSTINSDASFYGVAGIGFYPNNPNPSGFVQGTTPTLFMNNQVVSVPYTLSTSVISTQTIAANTGNFQSLNVSSFNPQNINTTNLTATNISSSVISTTQLHAVSLDAIQATVSTQLISRGNTYTNYIGGILGNPIHITSPFYADTGYVSTLNVSTLISPDIVSVSSLVSVEADIQLAVLSTLQFNPTFAPKLDLNMGGFVGGLVGSLGASAFNTVLGSTALGTGITGLMLPRTSGGVNNTVFQTVNGSTQLQTSTLNATTSNVFLTTNSPDPLHTPGTQISTVTTVPGGSLCIRSVSDPLNLADASPTSTIQSFGQWVPIITPATNLNVNAISTLSFTAGFGGLTTLNNVNIFGVVNSFSTISAVNLNGNQLIVRDVGLGLVTTISTLNVSTINGLPYSGGGGGGGFFAGMMMAWAGYYTVPAGWLICNGEALSRITYATLFAVIGTTYGLGDGTTTFNLPSTEGKMMAGAVDTAHTSIQVQGYGLNLSFNGQTVQGFLISSGPSNQQYTQIFPGMYLSLTSAPGSGFCPITAIIGNGGNANTTSSLIQGTVLHVQNTTGAVLVQGTYYIVTGGSGLVPAVPLQAPTRGAYPTTLQSITYGDASRQQLQSEVAGHIHPNGKAGNALNATNLSNNPIQGADTGQNEGLYTFTNQTGQTITTNSSMPNMPYNFASIYIIKY